ncbi:MurR/RpiR family transcriptional regulator [Roseovarius sp. 2305UL8-3]|uniref:MurR/RpiR family transcriptional regulator n=1 Tax=Roseovarius conchicola TaxID=3121636 RepID=UPI0035272928
MTSQAVSDRLTTETLRSLSPQLRKAARYVVEHPGEVATRSQRHVARTAKLSAPTFTRLAHAIGYDSYDELRDLCRAEVMQPRTLLAEKAQTLVEAGSETPDKTAFFTQHALAGVQNIETSLGHLDHDDLGALVTRLAKARRVVLVGVMSARPILEYTAYIANMSLGGWSLLGRDGDGAAGILADLGPEDAALVFSIAPYAATSVALARHLKAANVPVIAVTDNHLSPLTEGAQHCVYLSTGSPQFFPSHVAAMVFFEAVIGMVIRERGGDSQRKIARVELQNHELGEYWQDKPARDKGD